MSEETQVSEQPQAPTEPQLPVRARRTRSLWDWLQLLLVPVILIAGLLWLNVQQDQISTTLGKQQRADALKIAQEQQQITLVTNYMDRISDMLLHEKLLHSATIDDVRVVAQAETMTLLPQLDGKRKGMVVLFLMQTKLINNDFRVISLREADLRGAQLHGADIRDTYLLGANLQGADLSGSNLSFASLVFARLVGANLQGANLQGAELNNGDLTEANLNGANLKDAQGVKDDQLAKAKSLTGAILPDGSTHQ
jgi:uncharacterized protein YjbI with pentapeptide repeats